MIDLEAMDVWELALWVWLAAMVVVFLGWWAGTALQRWVDRARPTTVRRDWSTESKCRVTRRGFKTRAGIR